MSGTMTINDIRTWAKGADSAVPDSAWNIYTDSNGDLWWHRQDEAAWHPIPAEPFQVGNYRFITSVVPDGARQILTVIADEVLSDFLPAEADPA